MNDDETGAAIGTHSRAGVEKRLGGLDPEDNHVNEHWAKHDARNVADYESEGLRSWAVQGADWRRRLTYDVNACLGGIYVHTGHSRVPWWL